MGHHKKKSRSRDRSSERTSKRIRKLEDQIGVIAASLDVIQQAILGRDALTPELYLEGTADQTDDSGLTSQSTQPPEIQVVSETTTKVPENGNTKENDPPVDNAAKTAVSTYEVAKDSESETPWELDENGLRIFGEEPVDPTNTRLIKGTPMEAINICLASLEESTLKQYNGTLKLWWQWNKQVNKNPYVGSVEKILKFLSERFSDGVGHSAKMFALKSYLRNLEVRDTKDN
ncbi:hypothetical protein KQX54_011773 [Cotesia glomerata]|uniref:Core-binding (CB) domain-containing protein n=1 Tax=Cotesia glomerata TaxID=32391 RepID=A0AAV7HCW5_COTGL|nr:hypothetical protein KQX54_011773 [Cotesia glomerata]